MEEVPRPSHKAIGFPDDGIIRLSAQAKYGSTLSPREIDIIELKIEGLTNKEIAYRLQLTEQTVKNHVTNSLARTAAPNMVALVARYVRWQTLGYPQPEPPQQDLAKVSRRLEVLEARLAPLLALLGSPDPGD
jgi:DNA-binding CsgD family transcriptional regulator